MVMYAQIVAHENLLLHSFLIHNKQINETCYSQNSENIWTEF